MTIRARLALGVALLTVLVVLLVSGVQFLALGSFLKLAERERLELMMPELQATLNRQLSQTPTQKPVVRSLPRNVDVRVTQGRRIVVQTDEYPPIPLGEPRGYRPIAGHNVLITPITLAGRPATAQLASDALGAVNPLVAYLRALGLSVPAAAALVALSSFLLAGRLLRPLEQLETAAAAVGSDGNLRAPLPGVGKRDELGRLAGTLQATFRQLALLREREEEFTHAAAHDLRSPLAALKIRLQGSLGGPRTEAELRDDIGEALSDVDRMRTLTEHLLLLARGARDIQWLPLDLAGLAGESVDRARERAPDIRLDFETWGDATVLGDATLLSHLLENLIENGLRYGEGADMRVCVGREGAEVRLSLRDSGPGVSEAAMPRLTEPFYRADPARAGEGNGLGLAIVRRVAEAHGATLTFERRRPSGLHVMLSFRHVSAAHSTAPGVSLN